MEDNGSFLGTGWSFPPSFRGKARTAALSVAEDDIEESLNILMGTSPGERLLAPDYGCPLKAMQFEIFDSSTITEITDRVKRAILFHEPRIRVNAIQVALEGEGEGTITLTIDYTVRATNNRSNRVYPFHFLEGTLL